MKKTQILADFPNILDATSWYRGGGPVNHLHKVHNIDIITIQGALEWCNLLNIDALFMQRPYLPEHVEQALRAKNFGIPLWVDYDDYLLDIQLDNPAYKLYSSPQVQMNLKNLLMIADVVTVSTDTLKKHYDPFNKNVRVINNALDMHLMKIRNMAPPRSQASPLSIFWRGSDTHQRDLMEVKDAILAVHEKNPSVDFTFFGYQPWFITEKMNKHKFCNFSGVRQFFTQFTIMHADIMIVPLAFNDFNRCKSNIAAIEGALIGAACLAPNMPEWQIPGITLYEDAKDFEGKLNQMISLGKPRLLELARKTFEWILEYRTLDKMNNTRLEIIKSLTK